MNRTHFKYSLGRCCQVGNWSDKWAGKYAHLLGAIILFLGFMLLSACSGTRKLSDDEYLLNKAKIEYVNSPEIRKSVVTPYIQKALPNKSNTRILWMRPWVSLYNFLPEPRKEKGIIYSLKNKLGQEAFLYNKKYIENNTERIQKVLANEGFFNSEIHYQLISKKRSKTPVYIVNVNKPYWYTQVNYRGGSLAIDDSIRASMTQTSILPGKRYRLQELIDERIRISNKLNNKGYYYFKPDYLEFLADSVGSDASIKMVLRIKNDVPRNALNYYTIANIRVTDDYQLENQLPYDTILLDGMQYLTQSHHIRPEMVKPTIHFTPNDIYRRSNHLRTLNQLNELNTYKYTNITIHQVNNNQLDVFLSLVPANHMSLKTELDAALKSNHYAGPGVKMSLNRRNAFRGAELLNLSLGGRFETQLSESNHFSYELSADANLVIPRIFPLRQKQVLRNYLPSSTINLGGDLNERFDYYKLITMRSSLSYSWRRNNRFYWGINPIEINFSNLISTTAKFKEFLFENPSIRRSFEDQFILGSAVNFNYKSANAKSPFYAALQIDGSGNLLSLIFRSLKNEMNTPDNPYQLFNEGYAQFVRTQTDLRYSFPLPGNVILASRAFFAVGLPYNNSLVMPHIKQFSVGGANSLRGFYAQSVGPGSFEIPIERIYTTYTDQTGDIKLEANVEIRHTIWGILKGAFFTDAGNIWLAYSDASRRGGVFDWQSFTNEIAVSAGYGIRIDISPLVVRFDYSWPFRYPYKKDDSYWQFDNFDFGNRSWRKENLILNISLGYPF